MLNHNHSNHDEMSALDRADSESSVKTESDAGDQKPNRKRKRKGLGNWTRTTLACNRCRKMKIRVFVPFRERGGG